eukprot:gene6512-7542_t
MSTTTTTNTQGVVNASDILQANNFGSHLVDKEDTLLYDLHNLCAFDYSGLNKVAYKEDSQTYIDSLARDNVQLLITRMFQLPIKAIEEGAMACLTKGLTPLPRERSLPESKPKTRWEAFADTKGIKKRKKNKMEWDEKHKEYRPTRGAFKANDTEDVPWIEAKAGDKVGEDPWDKMKAGKKERVDKQKKREQRNLEESSVRSGTRVGKTLDFSKDNRKILKTDINNTFNVAKVSTASLGKFDRLQDGERAKPSRGVKKLKNLGDERNLDQESQSSLKIIDRVFNKQSVVNVDKAANQYITAEQKEKYKNKRFNHHAGGGGGAKRHKK